MTSAATDGRRDPLSWFRSRMRPAAHPSPEVARRDTARVMSRLLPPLALIIVVVLVICAVIAYAVARQIEEQHEYAHREALAGTIEEFRGVLADVTVHVAANLAAARASAEAEMASHLVPLARSRYRYAHAYVIDGEGRLLAAFPAGESGAPPAILRLIEKFRAERAGPPASPPAPGKPATDFLLIGDLPALAAVAELPIRNEAKPPVVATVIPLDGRLISLIEQTAGFKDLKFDTAAADRERVVQPLLDRSGRIIGWLNWSAERPLMDAVLRLIPLLAIVAACFVAFALMAIQLGRREARGDADRAGRSDEDPLTHAANRERILEILDRALAARLPEQTVMLAFLNLDRFKDFNDIFGHRGGDLLLAAAATRLTESLPASAVLGRMGGDEFAVVMTAASPVAAVDAANAAMNAVMQPFTIANQTTSIGVSVGLALAPRDGESRDELMRRADLALRAAKRGGRGSVVGFDLQLEQEFHDRRFILRGLRRALAEDGLDVRYQPIVSADSQRIVGIEALLRWRHRTRGDIPPEVFIPIAEQAGLMAQLGEFVMRRALADATRWKNLYVAVNLSPLQVRDPALIDLVSSVVRQTGIAPGRVVLEITEGVLIDEPEKVIKRLDKLRALGVKIALDDFGSGFSSLSYLQRFPIDKLKIDKGFVAPLGRSESGAVIIQAIIGLGRALGLSVLVEGVETEEQRALLRLAGCDEMQGHLFYRSLSAGDVDALLAKVVLRA